MREIALRTIRHRNNNYNSPSHRRQSGSVGDRELPSTQCQFFSMIDKARSNAVVAAVVVVLTVVDRCAESTRAKVKRTGDSSVQFGRVHSWTLGMLPETGALFRVRESRPKKDVTRSDDRDDEMGRKKNGTKGWGE